VDCHLAGVTRLKDRRFISYDRRAGLASDLVYALYQASDNSIWAGTRDGLAHLQNGQSPTTELVLPISPTGSGLLLRIAAELCGLGRLRPERTS